ncbi:MAG: hypothetical protein DIU75_002020 [Mycolicibacterium hassiacum]|uniref:hypothetical protein n=1 Tax=Mycolicibacterium hassiacum TaxID=46351 RepID=UPI0023F8F8F4|nr:hypothetical protein [Mycolicibacterium hassiacum]
MSRSHPAFRRVLGVAALCALTGTGGALAALHGGASGIPLAKCTSGEEHDVYTTTCVPFLAPRTPRFTVSPANPDVPELDGIPCIGASANACFALAESQGLGTPEVVPRTSISASP